MPHAVLRGELTLDDVWLAFQPVEFHENEVHYRAQEAYLSTDKGTLLIRCVVVERGFPKKFFVRMTEAEGEITIGLEPLAGPERTDAVKRIIGLAAWRLLQASPEVEVLKTNIEEFITEPKG